MTTYLLLTLCFGLLALGAIVLLVIGLVKKRKPLLLTGAVVFALAAMGIVFAVVNYTRAAVDYVKGDAFQQDAKKVAELAGKTAGSITSGLSNGVAHTLDEQAISRLAHQSGRILGTSIKTMASALDSTTGRQVFLDSSLLQTAMEPGHATENVKGNTSTVAIFIHYKKPFNGQLQLSNYDQHGKTIEIAGRHLRAGAGEERVETFEFLHPDAGLTTYYILSVKPAQ